MTPKTILTTFLLLHIIGAFAQIDSHYWTHQYGAKGLLLNGAVIATADDETSIYYNPGAMALNDNLGFSFSFVTPTYSSLQSENFLGDNHKVTDSGFAFAPGFLAVRFKPFRTDKVVAGLTSFKRFKSDIKFEDRVSNAIGNGTDFLFRGDVKFQRKISEDWFGVGLAFRLDDNFGIGVTQFSSWHSEGLDLSFKKEILYSQNPSNVYASWRSEFDYDLSIYSGFLTKVGMSFRTDEFCIGFTYTSPVYGMFKASASYAIDDQKADFSDGDVDNVEVISNRKSVPVQDYYTPHAIGLGIDVHINDKLQTSFSAEYFQEITRYTLFEETDDSFDGLATGDADIYVGIQTDNQNVLNVAGGFQYRKNEKITWLGGFRTDFNESNNLLINETANFLSTTPNVFHISGGSMLLVRDNIFSFGLDVGYGKTTGGAQLTDLSDVKPENIYTFSGKNNVNNRFVAVMVFITYDFLFK